MQIIDKQELISISGGVTINGTLINAFMKGINTFLDLGRTLGSAVYRVVHGSYCSI